MKTIPLVVQTPNSDYRAPRIIKKHVKKFGKNTIIGIQQNPGII